MGMIFIDRLTATWLHQVIVQSLPENRAVISSLVTKPQRFSALNILSS